MTRVAAVVLYLAACSCGTTAAERKELTIQTALDSAVLACQAGLNDPASKWDVGAKEYCRLIVSGGCQVTK